LFELKVAGLSLGRPIDPVTFKNMSEEDRYRVKDDSKPRDYLNLSNRTKGDRKNNRLGPFPRDWKTGRVDDDQLADALIKAITVPAASFKARGVPHVMRVIEILVRHFLSLSQLGTQISISTVAGMVIHRVFNKRATGAAAA